MPDVMRKAFGKRLLATGIFLLVWAHSPLPGGDWSWTPIQLGVVPLDLLQLAPSRADVYGLAAGGVLAQKRSVALSGALWNSADANFLAQLGVVGALNDNNFALNVGGLLAGSQDCNFGVNVGGFVAGSQDCNFGVNVGFSTSNEGNCGLNVGGYTFTVVNYGVNVSGFAEIGRVNYGLNICGCDKGLLLNCGVFLGVVPYCLENAGLCVGVYNVVGASGLLDWKFGTDLQSSGGMQIGLLNVGCGFQLGLLNYNPCGPVRLLPLLNFGCH